jgi:hypothetical protein
VTVKKQLTEGIAGEASLDAGGVPPSHANM